MLPQDLRRDLAERGRRDLFFLSTAVLGYRDLYPPCHGPLCVFVDSNTGQFRVVLMPRDHLKTSIVTIGGTLQEVLRNVNARCLIANESATNAERMLRAIRQHAEGNRVFRTLYSDIIPKDTATWNNSELVFNRQWVGPEPTIDTVGMTGAFTSRHYTYITCDDPISEEAIKSEKVMKDTIDRFSRFLSLLVDPSKDRIILVGTRWAMHDIYSWTMNMWGSMLTKFVRAAVEDDEIIWPARFTPEILAIKRASFGDYVYSCLYLNNPKGDAITGLNVQDLGFWETTVDEKHVVMYTQDQDRVNVESVAMDDLDVTVTVDLAPAETVDSDRNAVTTVGVTSSGRAVVLDAWAKRCTPMDVIEKLFEVKNRYHPRVFGIEGVAYQKAFKWFLKAEAEKRGVYINVKELKALDSKKRHVLGLQPIMATRRLFIHPTQFILRDEMFQYPNGRHDDVIDALGMQQQLWRGIMSPEYFAKLHAAEQRMMRVATGDEDVRVHRGLVDPGADDFFGSLFRERVWGPKSPTYIETKLS